MVKKLDLQPKMGLLIASHEVIIDIVSLTKNKKLIIKYYNYGKSSRRKEKCKKSP